MKNKNNVLIALSILLLIGSSVGVLYLRTKITENQNAIKNIHVEQKKEFIQEVLPEDVLSYETDVKKSIDQFLKGSADIGKFTNDKGYAFLSSLFVVTGIPVVEKKAIETVKGDYYKPFSYEFTNFSIRSTKTSFTEFEAYVDVSVKYNGTQMYKTLISIKLDKDRKIIGGTFYGQA